MLKNLQKIYNSETISFGILMVATVSLIVGVAFAFPIAVLIVLVIILIGGPVGYVFLKLAERGDA